MVNVMSPRTQRFTLNRQSFIFAQKLREMLKIKVVVLGLNEGLNLLLELLRDFIDGSTASVTMNHELNAFLAIATQVTFNGSS